MPNLGEIVLFTMPHNAEFGRCKGQERVAMVTAVHDDGGVDLLVMATMDDIAHPFERNTAKFGPVKEGTEPGTFKRQGKADGNKR